MKPFDPSQFKTFKTPKYTGVTLSLLSMFVITAMMVIWDKISEQNKPKFFINLVCDDYLQKPLTEIAKSFKEEFNVQVNLNFFKDIDEINLAGAGFQQSPNILISKSIPDSSNIKTIDSIPIVKKEFVLASDSNSTLDTMNSYEDLKIGFFVSNPQAEKIIREKFREDNRSNFLVRCKSYEDILMKLSNNKLDFGVLPYKTAHQEKLHIIDDEWFRQDGVTYYCNILESSQRPKLSFQFARYLTAIDKGQINFVRQHHKTIGEDLWKPLPVISVYCEDIYEKKISSLVYNLEEIEGIQINLLAPNHSDLLATLISISQSDVQNLIPDLLIVSSETENLISPNFIRSKSDQSEAKENSPFFLTYFESENKSTCQRIIKNFRALFERP